MSLRGRSLPDPDDQEWIDLIARFGHAIVKVADRADEPTAEPPFAYSLGAFESYGVPELILFGLEGDVAAEIINGIMDECRRGKRFRSGVPIHDIFGGDVPAVLLETDPARALNYATHADWYYERQPFPLWQIYWPAKNGCFPWDTGYPVEMAGWQPDLTSGDFAGRAT